MENGSDTPDFILAAYLMDCISSFDLTMKKREKWYGREVGNWLVKHSESATEEDKIKNWKDNLTNYKISTEECKNDD